MTNKSPLKADALAGQTLLITGASRGIGAAIASACLAAGATIFCSYARHPGALEDMAQKGLAQGYQGQCHYAQADLSDPGAADRLFQEATDRIGSLTGLINNAGVMLSTPLDCDDATWRADWATTHQVNVQAVADLSRRFVGQQQGTVRRLINIASRAAFRGDTVDALHYAASKAAVVALTRSLARGMAHDGVRAFTIAPGWVKTDMASVAYEPGNEWMLAEIPVGDAAAPSDFGHLCAFLLSGACDNSTGATFDVNGASYVR